MYRKILEIKADILEDKIILHLYDWTFKSKLAIVFKLNAMDIPQKYRKYWPRNS